MLEVGCQEPDNKIRPGGLGQRCTVDQPGRVGTQLPDGVRLAEGGAAFRGADTKAVGQAVRCDDAALIAAGLAANAVVHARSET